MNSAKLVMDGAPRAVFSNVEALHAMGLSVPESAEIASRLRALGVPLPEGIFTTEKLAESILEWRGGAAQ